MDEGRQLRDPRDEEKLRYRWLARHYPTVDPAWYESPREAEDDAWNLSRIVSGQAKRTAARAYQETGHRGDHFRAS